MAKPADNSTTTGDTPEGTPKKFARLRRLGTRYWVLAVVLISLGVHGVLFALHDMTAEHADQAPTELALGEYKFVNLNSPSRVAAATFELHISLLGAVDRLARPRLVERQFRVQQDIEELMRQANPTDFDDPTLSELKRQIQEKINETLEMRAVDAVIITDLALRIEDRTRQAETSTAQSNSASASPEPSADFVPSEVTESES